MARQRTANPRTPVQLRYAPQRGKGLSPFGRCPVGTQIPLTWVQFPPAPPLPRRSFSEGRTARVAELVYATDLKSVARKGLWVRLPPRAPRRKGGAARIKTAKEPVKNLCSNHILILGEENFLILMETNDGLGISNEIKFFGTTGEEVELRKFNIFIGISLGNKLLTKELAKAYVEWALERTKENIGVLIADEIDVVNWMIFNSLDETSAGEKVSNKAQGLDDMFSRAIKIIAREKDSTVENRVKVIRWRDVKTDRFNKLLATLES